MLGRDQPVNSYWYTAYAAAEDGHDYFVVACHSYSANLSEIITYVSFYDVDTQEYYGTNVVVPARIPTTTYNIDGGGLRVCASTPDLVSTQHAIVLFPDGQNQVHAIDPDLQERNPFVTPNNNTYYTDLNFNIPTLDLYLNVSVPAGVGEMAEEGNLGGSTTLYGAYALYSGTLEGDSIKGFGLVERTFQFGFA
ncbi:hypothetical protein FB567DRAFT_585591 [Paraphoma chrysanthemicola]|uniref:Uncharacterized protein n=1 Tax=Paraphoma chrysanthemicola TaxID=798071 RepID=A0A8K0QRS9_9PLEO|nr:hypothetical protein FB567DRAFT_585591 [Paraphoma chrysanthemicola]